MRHVLRVLAVALVYLGTPGLPEAVEDLSHMAREGHSLHAPGHEAERGCEHGCSGPVHRCQCCHSMSFLPSSSPPSLGRACAVRWAPWRASRSGPEGHPGGVTRPPSA